MRRAADQRQTGWGRDSAEPPLRFPGPRAASQSSARQFFQQDHRQSHCKKDGTGKKPAMPVWSGWWPGGRLTASYRGTMCQQAGDSVEQCGRLTCEVEVEVE